MNSMRHSKTLLKACSVHPSLFQGNCHSLWEFRRQVSRYLVWLSPFLPTSAGGWLRQTLFDNLPYLALMQKVCSMHRWSSYLLGNSVLLLCIEQLGRSKCWDQSLGCPLLLLHSNPQTDLCRTWVPCQYEIAQRQHPQHGRCPFGSAALCHERHTWKTDRGLYSPTASQCGVEHAADGAVS